MTTSCRMTKWVTSLLLFAVVAQACSRTETPVAPQGVSSGTLSVSIRVTGTRPDPRGYVVVVRVGGEGDYAPQTVPTIGGTVLFPDLPPGTHSVRLESLAENCSVADSNPRRFTLAGQTAQVEFTVACPGSGAVLLRTVTTGEELDPDGYTIQLRASATRAVPIGANDSLLISEKDLPPAVSWRVSVHGMPANCWSVSPNPVTLRLAADATTRIDFSVQCISSIALSGNVYHRVSPYHWSTLEFHGSLSERYILYENGAFRLEFSSAKYGDFGYPGFFSRAQSVITFDFHDDGRWQSTGTLRGDSLFVQYNLIMGLSDFEDGMYVRYPRTP